MVEISDDDVAHIFRDAPGHLVDTPENRRLLIEMAGDRTNFVGQDRYGTNWYAKVLPDGRQLWAQVRDGRLRNGGMNDLPRDYFNPLTGLVRKG